MHCAILNDPAGLLRARRAAWDGYVGATRNVVDAANTVGAHVVLDLHRLGLRRHAGRRDRRRAAQPDQRLRLPEGRQRARRARARTSAARWRGSPASRACTGRGPDAPRAQDAGFGYLVAVAGRRAARRAAVHGVGGPDINMIATPTLATDAAELMWRLRRARAHRHLPLLRRRVGAPRQARAPRRGRVRARRRPAAHRPPRSRRCSRAAASRTTRASTRGRPPRRWASSCPASTRCSRASASSWR